MQELTMEEVNAVAGGDYLEMAEAVGSIAVSAGFATGDIALAGAGAALYLTAAYFK
jgi:hypothetical protein